MATKRLFRSRNERVIWGVCGGLAQYFAIDPVIVRILMVLLAFADGIGILAYIIMAIAIPGEDSTSKKLEDTARENAAEIRQTAEEVGNSLRSGNEQEQASDEKNIELKRRRRIVIGVIIIVVGLIFLATNFNLFWWFSWNKWWPVTLIIAGLLIVFSRTRRSHSEK